VGIVLWAVGVRFALLWAVLTFLCNFIPYIGTVVAYSLPVGFAFLWFGPTWEPFAAAGLLLVCHGASASVVEPLIIGNAVGVSPLVILGSLAFWGLMWGIPGMFLAVPLTVVAILVMEHFEMTRPVARMLRGG
jgi:AI-2 transport protein TqsA